MLKVERLKSISMFRFIFLILSIYSSLMSKEIIILNDNQESIDILQKSQIYFDNTALLTFDDILNSNINFQDNNTNILSFGYGPNFKIWIKFTLRNNSEKQISKIIEYVNPLTTNVDFYTSKENVQHEGIFNADKNKKSLSPIFEITLKPQETKTYYMNISSHITTLIIQLKLWDVSAFYNNELEHQLILALFFGAMFILGIYNLFIFFFTKDISYLFYVTYILGLIFHQLIYVGFANTYFFNSEQMKIIIGMAVIVVAIPIFSLGLFTKYFLQTIQYPIHNKILNIFLFLVVVNIVFILSTDNYDRYRNIVTMLLLVYLMYLTIFSVIKKNKQAIFILFGWSVFLISGMLMYLSSLGLFNINSYIPYFIEMSFILEAVIFSIALANKINNLQKEKNEANRKLILQKKEETKKLEKIVNKKTKDLKNALKEKETLLQELNHRVKNNMQMIISLIRLQMDDINDYTLKKHLQTIHNRISAMSHLHELLYIQDNYTQIKTYDYFHLILNEIKETLDSNIQISLNITTDLKLEDAIYCGLIINELVTNSCKYAFSDNNGHIEIKLQNNNKKYQLEVNDDGMGYDIKINNNSLGLMLVETLAVQQLDGSFEVKNNNGTKSIIKWNKNA